MAFRVERGFHDFQMNRPACCFIFLLLFCGTASGQANILGLSAFQACIQASFPGATLNCSNTQNQVTVLDLQVEPLAGPPRTQFVVELKTIPPNAEVTQYSTTSACVAPGGDGRCLVTDPTFITVTTTRPVLSYALRPVASSRSYPFRVPWCYYYINKVSSKPSDSSPTDRCLFKRTYSSVGKGEPPDDATVTSVFNNTALNNQRIRCSNVKGTPPSGVAGPCNNVLTYSMDCFKASDGKPYKNPVKLTAQFCELAPMCTVYQIVNPPAVIGEITINAYNQRNGNVSITLQNFGAGSSQSDPKGLILARVEAALSTDGFYGPDVPGIIIVCEDTGSDTINMVPDGYPPYTNPWTLAKDAGLLDPSFKLPVSEIIELISGRTCGPHCMWYYVNMTLAQALGTTFGKYGIPPSLYEFLPDELFIRYFTTFDSSSAYGIPIGKLEQISDILTGVPGFGFEYLGLKSTTACSANSYFRQIMDNTTVTRPLNLPPGWDPLNPMWISENRLYSEMKTDISSFELIIQFSGSFVGVVTSVVKASVDTELTSCWIDLSQTPPNGTIFLRVCNDAPDRGTRDNDAAFEVTTTCDLSSGLLPVTPLFSPVIRPQECSVVNIPVRAAAVTIPQGARCTSTVYAAGSTVDPRSIVMQSVEVGCVVAAALPPPATRAINISALEPTVLPKPERPPKGNTKNVLWGWFAFMGLVIGGLVLATIAIAILQKKSTK